MSEKTSAPKEYEQVMPFKFPSKEDMDDAFFALGLSESGKECLIDILKDIDADIKEQKLYLTNHLTRDEAIKKLKEVEAAIKKLRSVFAENANILPAFIPHKALEDIGELFTIDAINKAIGRDIRPVAPSEHTQKLLAVHNISPAEPSNEKQEAAEKGLKREAGFAYTDKLLIHALDTLIMPIDEWHVERRRLSKGGRTPSRSRRDFILVLALNSEKIIGVKPSSDVKSEFSTLCELVFEICGVPLENLKNLIGEIVAEPGLLTNTIYL
jgi:hypothetical protein